MIKTTLNLVSLFDSEKDQLTKSAGQVVFREGDEAHELFVVLSGEVELRVGDQVVEVVQPGGLFGELALVESSPRSAAAVVKTDAVLVPINERRFTYLVANTPFFALHVMGVLAGRLRRASAPDGREVSLTGCPPMRVMVTP